MVSVLSLSFSVSRPTSRDAGIILASKCEISHFGRCERRKPLGALPRVDGVDVVAECGVRRRREIVSRYVTESPPNADPEERTTSQVFDMSEGSGSVKGVQI